jgi:putative nucleotidyltransferase with HDIG domain
VPLETVLQRITEISSLPQVALNVMELANNPESGARDLKEAVESDPALSARVLKTVNSSAFGLRSKITNLQQAISLLGLSQLRNLAITASVSECFKGDSVAGAYRQSGLWKHMVAVAICSRLIATRCKLTNFDDAFLAGLLHDLGIILADQHVHLEFTTMMRSITLGRELCEWEREYLGFTHTELGMTVARNWRFPSSVQAAIEFHHNSEAYTGEDATIVQCVEVANLVCTLKGVSSVGLKLVRLPRAALASLGMTREDLKVLVQDLDHELSLHESLISQVKK